MNVGKPHLTCKGGCWFAHSRGDDIRYTRSWYGPDEACRKWYRMMHPRNPPSWASTLASRHIQQYRMR